MRKNAPEGQRVKVEDVAIKEGGAHSKIKGTVTKEIKELNTKVHSRKVIRVTKVERGKEGKELDTKEAIKELDTKEVIHGPGPVATNGNPEMIDTNSRERRKEAKAKHTGNRKRMMQDWHPRMIGVRQQWMSMMKSVHETTVPETKAAHGMISLGWAVPEKQKRGRGMNVRTMRSKKSWHDTSETLSEGKPYRER